MKSRYNARHSKRKQNIILNSLIGIVGVVILVLVINIFFNGGNTEPTAGEETQSNATESTQSASNNSNNTNTEDTVTSDEADSSDSAKEEENDKDSNEEESSKEDEKDAEENESSSEEESSNDPSGEVNLDGPWEPVGTEQTTDGNHVSNYDKGSVDWNEKLEAVETVVGYPKEEMVVHWLGGNGGPQKSEATVSQKGGDDTQYVVELEWVEDKGWKAVSARKK
ncbi:YrrS family protein [Guptibacillus algicola]|uniref:YrrS family protein n=1 Tax=Guptibacillus algicola TaxID=225844 RepID=UPI001CD5BDA2|nr:YrrS family protein [Alkalihalobacillus algicola]MCA0986152.1 YrrS family protein [Alkalihalobacillus algicola]